MSTNALTQGVHHVGLTVPDLQATRRFFVEILGFDQVGEVLDYPAVFLSDSAIMLTLWQADRGAAPFDRRRCVGLHHLALAVADHQALDAVQDRVAGCEGVDIEFAPEALGHSGARHMMCAIPGGIRVEFISTTA